MLIFASKAEFETFWNSASAVERETMMATWRTVFRFSTRQMDAAREALERKDEKEFAGLMSQFMFTMAFNIDKTQFAECDQAEQITRRDIQRFLDLVQQFEKSREDPIKCPAPSLRELKELKASLAREMDGRGVDSFRLIGIVGQIERAEALDADFKARMVEDLKLLLEDE